LAAYGATNEETTISEGEEALQLHPEGFILLLHYLEYSIYKFRIKD
jgi:hypothetical protein